MVFQTAPPQPASKARITCSPQLVGGADANQNGFGELMPAVFAARLGAALEVGSAMSGLVHEGLRDADGCPLTVGYGVDNLATAVHTVSTGKVLRVIRLARSTFNDNSAVL